MTAISLQHPSPEANRNHLAGFHRNLWTGCGGSGQTQVEEHNEKLTLHISSDFAIISNKINCFALLLVLLFGLKIKYGCYLLGWKTEGLLHSTQLRKQSELHFTLGLISVARQTDCKALPYLSQQLCAWLVPLNSVVGVQFCRNGLSN